MSRIMTVGDRMTPIPETIERTRPIAEAVQLMQVNRIHHLPVMTRGTLVGIVSDRDLMCIRGLKGIDLERTPIEAAMTPEPYCVPSDAPLDHVVEEMARRRIGCVMVMDGRALIGMFTAVDAYRTLAKLLSS
jgi:acetoin utilization protein AcuB